MTMDKSAIEHIQQSSGREAAVNFINHTLTGKPVALVPEHYKLEDIEKYFAAPQHFRGRFATAHIASFVAYVEQHKQTDTAVFVSPDDMQARAEITLGTTEDPKHRLHSAKLELEKTQPFRALLSATREGTRHSQEDLAFWLQDWADHISCLDQDLENEIALKDAIKAVRQLKVNESVSTDSKVQHFSAQKSTLEQIGISSESPLPGYLRFSCHPYKELKERDFLVRLQVTRSERSVRLTLKPVGFEQHVEEMAEEFELLLQDDMQHLDLPFYIGVFS